MDKLIKGDKIAVIYHPNIGVSWVSFCDDGDLDLIKRRLFCRKLAVAIINKEPNAILFEIAKEFNLSRPYDDQGYMEELRVIWLPLGKKFIVSTYDGKEDIELLSEKIDIFET